MSISEKNYGADPDQEVAPFNTDKKVLIYSQGNEPHLLPDATTLIPLDQVNLIMSSDVPKPNPKEAMHFLSILADGEEVTFQTFDDSNRKDGSLVAVRHGFLDEYVNELIELNRKGAGIFVTVNRTDLKGRSASNIEKVRAVFVDLDNAPLQSVDSAPISPHITVESSPGKFHVYWLIEGVSLNDFTTIQKQLAGMFGGDPKVVDLARVMRLPGFVHQKKSPFLTRIIGTSIEQPVNFETFINAFGIDLEADRRCKNATRGENQILEVLEARGMIIERKRYPQGCIVIKCPWADLHSTEDKGTCYYEPHTNGYQGHGFKCFHSHCMARTINDLKLFLDITQEDNFRFTQEPFPLSEELFPVAPFTEDMLPNVLRPWIMDCTERMQVPPDFLAASSLVVLGSLIGRKVGIYPKSQDDWLVVPNLWGAIVGRPSLLKSPAIAEVMKYLDRLVTNALQCHKTKLQEYEQQHMWQEAQKSAQKEQLKKAAKKPNSQESIPQLPVIQSINEPVLKRYKTEDATVEKLGEILRDNPQGILVHRDELTGWLKSLDRYGREGDRAFFLESWNGNGAFTVDRIGRGTLHIPALCLSILGGIQPGPLGAYVHQAANEGYGDDGLLQRFQVLVWPDAPKDWKNVDRKPDKDAEEKVGRIFRALDAFEPFEPFQCDAFKTKAFNFSEIAQEIFDTWRTDLEQRLRTKELSPALESHFAKYRSLMPSLALIFYLIKTVGNEIEPIAVDQESVELAIKWCTYLETHAKRLYSSAVSPGLESARALLSKIESGDLLDGFSPRSVYDKRHWAHLETAEKVTNALKILEEHGWIIQEKINTGGRPSIKIHVHPLIRRQS